MTRFGPRLLFQTTFVPIPPLPSAATFLSTRWVLAPHTPSHSCLAATSLPYEWGQGCRLLPLGRYRPSHSFCACTKMTFRIICSFSIFGSDPQGVDVIAEYLIKAMGNTPGLSRERIIAQLNKEYEVDVASMIAKCETRALDDGSWR
jgi:hypothetical protein